MNKKLGRNVGLSIQTFVSLKGKEEVRNGKKFSFLPFFFSPDAVYHAFF